ncbi:MAG: zinc ribbon domain-containing protein [Ruminococcus sp.]|nr:zinc ribbon domain-containing protein [Ruminococcus sp.]
MKNGKVSFRAGVFGATGLLNVPAADFTVDNTLVDTLSLSSHTGCYCPKCGKFTLSFNLRKNAVFEDGFDMDLDDELDCLPQKSCPDCGEAIDFDYPKCPGCGYRFDENEENNPV